MLELESVRKEFGGITAVDGLSLTVGNEGLVGLIGPNGAGKSTLMNLITGKLSVTAGSIEFNGEEITSLPQHEVTKRGIGQTYQVTRLFPRVSVRDNITVALLDDKFWSTETFFSALGKRTETESERVENAIELLEIDRSLLSEQPDQLTHLDRRKTALARAVVQDPELLLLDEPFAGLTSEETEILRESIRTLNESGKAVIIVDHNISDMSNLCERLVVMRNGSILKEGTPQEVLDDEEVRSAYLGE
jgi:ABC-type branched-subunit amino acid transport system ATPase component